MPPALRKIFFPLTALAAAFAVLWLVDHKFFRRGAAGEEPEPYQMQQRPRVDLAQLPVSTALNDELALVVERVMPGVVSVHVERRRKVTEPVLRAGAPPREEEREITDPSVGSGALVTREGHILTNWHVVEGGEGSIAVTLNGEELPRRASLIDKDDQLDIAILKVEPRRKGETFPALRLGDSDKVRRGHMVLAMGSPFDLTETITWGIISHRERRVSDTYTHYLQTTCTINPGNSGGPLVNLQGDIIGIITRKLLGPDDNISAEGYGLAIPSNDAAEALERLLSKGRPRLYLGLTVDDWPERYWQKQKSPEAVIVKGVTKRSPAEKAGLQFNDIIEAVDDARVTSTGEFRRHVHQKKVGDSLALTIRRGGAAQKLPVVLADFDKALPPESTAGPVTVRGVTVRPLRRYERNLLGQAESIGLAVEAVAADSPFSAVLSRGMNVLHVSDPARLTVTSIATPQEFSAALDALAATGGFIVTARPGERDRWIEFSPLP